ncbi:uncharacterized protein YdbL (DUF1318 family) [Luteibacter rhizovicinus]|uniref:Uncharacterized protein YdbL (DUF1318 family) n=1 Tax=Luteibacter rhizovicinus TaxID=242606 RepID=A0A4R3YZZ3_9GAMM|nr:YdbL family protein [Luteibacter rhizovicinus]TCV97508.1 uncharacterized protein YdbL (DUF1318 family) [Luteibacter rhizovicinus]
MRQFYTGLLATAFVALVGCVTINVYFPEAAAQKAADQFIGNVLDDSGVAPAAKGVKPATPPAAKPASGQQPSASLLDLIVPTAYAAESPDVRIQTPATEAIRERMKQRFRGSLKGYFDQGAVGFTADGMVAVRDASQLPLADRSNVNAVVADENRDRAALYREVANANGHPEWESRIRGTFASGWIERAPPGWYYQDASGAWKRR